MLDDILLYMMRLTSYISDRFLQFIEHLVLRDADRYSEGYVVNDAIVSSVQCPESYNSSISSQPQIVGSNHSICESGAFDDNEELLVNTKPIYVDSTYISVVAPLCLKGIKSRMWKTLHGSTDDIGWLQNAPGRPPIEDGTTRFLDLLSDIRNGEHSLPNSYVYLLIPGTTKPRFFSKMGLACHIAKVHSEASVEHNAWELKLYIEELHWGAGKRVMLLGHSKGGVDAAAALSLYWSDLKDKVAGLALVQSPYGGTPMVSDILCEGQIGDREIRRIMELLICKVVKGDIRALEDLTYEKRKEFIMKHELPMDIPLISFHSEASITPGVLATMTHIAHAELPRLSLPYSGADESDACVQQRGRQVPVVILLSAAMAVCAIHLKLRYGEKSDGLVTCRDAEVPGSVVETRQESSSCLDGVLFKEES